MRARLLLLIVIVLLAGLGVLAGRAILPGVFEEAPPPAATAPLFAASFPDQAGQTQALSQWRGQVVVLNFWATWCPPCREEMPELSAFHEKYRSHGIVLLGLSTDDAAKIAEYARNTPVSYPLLAGDFQAMALAESLGNDRGVLPYTVVIDRAGTVAYRYLGRVDMRLLEQDVLALASADKQL